MHEHDHTHEGGCCGTATCSDHKEDQAVLTSMDPASQSLANALRVSFRLLTLIMIGVVVAFLLTGFKSIRSNEKGIIKVFGRQIGTSDEGLSYVWPFPVGEIDVIQVDGKDLTLRVDDFWMNEKPKDIGKPVGQRQADGPGLMPDRDGYVLTGDQNLLHLRLLVTYRIEDAKQFASRVVNVKEMLRSVICQATIRSAATRTADALLRTEQAAFLGDVQAAAQARLDQLHTGLAINRLQLEQATVPLRAIDAYNQYTNAISQAQAKRNEAISQASQILNAAAGQGHFEKLVGSPWAQSDSALNEGLIYQYERARVELEAAREKKIQVELAQANVAQIEKQISDTLASSSGQVSQLISDAQTYSTQTSNKARQWAQAYEGYLPSYKESPQLTLENLWAATRDRILSASTVQKINVPPGQGRMVLRVNAPPEIVKQVDNAEKELQKRQEEKVKEQAAPQWRTVKPVVQE